MVPRDGKNMKRGMALLKIASLVRGTPQVIRQLMKEELSDGEGVGVEGEAGTAHMDRHNGRRSGCELSSKHADGRAAGPAQPFNLPA